MKDKFKDIPNYTPKNIYCLTNDDCNAIITSFDLEAELRTTNRIFPDDLYHVLAKIGKLYPDGHPEDYHVMHILDPITPLWHASNLLKLAVRRFNSEPTMGQHIYLKTLVTFMAEDNKYPGGIFLLKNDTIYKEMLQIIEYEEKLRDTWIQPYHDEMVEMLTESRNIKRIEEVLEKYDNCNILHICDFAHALIGTHDIPFINAVVGHFCKAYDLEFESESYFDALPSLETVNYLKSMNVPLPTTSHFILGVLKLDNAEQRKEWLNIVLSVDFWWPYDYPEEFDENELDDDYKEIYANKTEQEKRDEVLETIEKSELVALVNSPCAIEYFERIDHLMEKYPDQIPYVIRDSINNLDVFNHIIQIAENKYSAQKIDKILTKIIFKIGESSLEHKPHPPIHKDIFHKYMGKYLHDFEYFKKMVDYEFYDYIMGFQNDLTYEERNYFLLHCVLRVHISLFKRVLNNHPEQLVDINGILCYAIELGRFDMADLLMGKGANNLKEAILATNPEKRKWAERRYATHPAFCFS